MSFSVTDLSIILLIFTSLNPVWAACQRPIVRREWRMLHTNEKQNYITAVKCLQNTAPRTGDLYDGVRSRFDDFQATHINLTDFIHFVGHFQPWHRLFVARYEAELRSTCGYTGAQPYWNWSIDAVSEDAFVASPVFDATTGFGGNGPYIDSSNDTSVRIHIPGKTGGGCVEDGPFKNMTVNFGPGYNTTYNPHCLTRDLSPPLAVEKLNSTGVAYTMAANDFAEFDVRVQGGIDVPALAYHGGGHLSVGGDLGEIGNVYSSPGDPLFYLHHANMDRLWNIWQKQNWPARKYDIAGPDTQFGYPFNLFGDIAYTNVTLDYVMEFKGLTENRNISEVMDITSGALCYTYA